VVPHNLRLFVSPLFSVLFVLSQSNEGYGHETIENDVDLIWVCKLDLETNTIKRLFTVPELGIAGSLAVSADEKWVAFDGSKPGQSNTVDTHLFVAGIDGTGLTDLGDGALPSWSPDGSDLAFCRYKDRGVWITNRDGSVAELIERDGWGPQWSPDGKSILYSGRNDDNEVDFLLMDLSTNESKPIFGGNGHPYKRLFFNSVWSPDGNRIIFKATRKNDTSEVASVSVSDSRDLKPLFLRNTYANFGLVGDNKIIVPYGSKSHGTVQLHLVTLSRDGPVKDAASNHLAGQFTHRNSYGAAVSSDFRRAYFLSVPKK